MKEKIVKLYRYEELPDKAKQRVVNDIIDAEINVQFDATTESLEEMFTKFEWIKDFKALYRISYSQVDYVGVEFEFRRIAIKSNTIKNILKDCPDLEDVVLAYRELIKNLKIGEWFIVKFKHYGLSFDIDFRDLEGNSHDFSRNYHLEVNDADLKKSAIINFVKKAREYVKKDYYSLLDYIYSDNFIKDEVAYAWYNISEDEVENDKI